MLSSKADAVQARPIGPSPEDYRSLGDSGDLVRFPVRVKQTDLLVAAERPLVDEAVALVRAGRADLEAYIADHPDFLTSLVPLVVDDDAPALVKTMATAAARTGVGPMAAVAGAIAEFVGRGLAEDSPEVIVENGGDVYCVSKHARSFLLLAESSGFGALRVKVDAGGLPFGVCTSAGTLGHSLSFGRADAVMVAATDTALADAAATALANRVEDASHLESCVEAAKSLGVLGLVAIAGDNLAAWGAVELEA